MEFYLQECNRNLKNASKTSNVQVVLGNEACDLDSAVSSLVTAYYLHKVQKSQEIVVPVLNVKRSALPLRTEVVFFLEETSISTNDLICIDEIDLKELVENNRLTIVLVDHNLLSLDQSYLEPYVVQIIDHHAVRNPERLKNCRINIESVGSCCTLVAEEIFNVKQSIMDPQIAMLLYGTILLDTVCLEDSAKRVTDKDKQMVSKLEAFLEGISKDEVFQTLQRVKFDVSNLTSDQLLLKDTKIVSCYSSSIAIASLPLLLEDCLEDSSMVSALDHLLLEKQLISVVLLGSKISSDTSSIRRQIAVFSRCTDILDKLSNYLKLLVDPSLELHPLISKVDFIVAFEQGNVTLTRKFVLPAIEMFLKSEYISGNLKKDDHMDNGDHTDSPIANGVDETDYSPEQIPSYQAETLDFPNSPKQSRFFGISVELQEHQNCIDVFEPIQGTHEQADMKGLMSPEGYGTLKKKISVHPYILRSDATDDDQKSLSSLSNKSDLDLFSPTDDIILPDDMDTLDELENSDYIESSTSEPIPEMSAAEEFEEERSWKSCLVNGEERKIDMKVIEPYRKVLSHGGYQGSTRNAIIVFSACYLPDRSRKDYDYVMDNLFLYVITTLDQLVAEDYILVYLHGATERTNMPSFGWLKRCYQMIDRRLRKNLKGLYLVHPTFWLKTIVIMTRPFISTKFSRKLRFVYNLEELSALIPLDQVSIPEKVKQFDEEQFPDS